MTDDETEQPLGATIEIVERVPGPVDPDSNHLDESVIFPNEVRINGRPVLTPDGESVKVHEIVTGTDGDWVRVTLTVLARRVTIGRESGARP